MSDDLYLKGGRFALSFLESRLGAKLIPAGDGLNGRRSVIYVSNHFTRLETVVLPYLIYKYSDDYAASLADKSLFVGLLKKFFSASQVYSTADPDRDRIILRDLITGQRNWIIYPEGCLVKNRSVGFCGKVQIETPEYKGLPHTGAAILALKAEILRQYMLYDKSKRNRIHNEVLDWLDISPNQTVSPVPVAITPVNITYYPLRPGNNVVLDLLQKLNIDLSSRAHEELAVEGALLLKETEIRFHFSKPITLETSAEKFKWTNRILPFWKELSKSNFLLKRFSQDFTHRCMLELYRHTWLTFDHVFAAFIYHYPVSRIDIKELQKRIIVCITKLQQSHLDLHPTLKNFTVARPWFLEDKLNELIELGQSSEMLMKSFDGSAIERYDSNKTSFHEIRVDNPIQVIYNECSIIKKFIKIVTETCEEDIHLLDRDLSQTIYKSDSIDFANEIVAAGGIERQDFLQHGPSFYLPGTKDLGIVLFHGLFSMPGAIKNLAESLQSFGYHVYAPRLAGHGTHSSMLENITWQDWLQSCQHGLNVLQEKTKNIFAVGFSTGGLLALNLAAHGMVKGVVTIASPSSLKDANAGVVPFANAWNKLLGFFNVDQAKILKTENQPSWPETSYSIIYLNTMLQLDSLIQQTLKVGPEVDVPTLLMHGKVDPTVSPKSMKRLLRSLPPSTQSYSFEYDRHHLRDPRVIDEVAFKIQNFIQEQKGVLSKDMYMSLKKDPMSI
ncbi:MAG: alpha/beta fold hydrolase [Lentisphaeria bacterium]|nr:alpha/beta fold hydrolase [Lentisphaeria bacterium]